MKEAERKAILERKEKAGAITQDEKSELATINQTDKARDQAIKAVCTDGNKGGSGCGALVVPAQEALKKYGENVTYSLLYKDLYPQDAKNLESVLQSLDAGSIGRDQAITAIAEASGISWEKAASRYDTAIQLQTMTAAIAGLYGIKGIETTPNAGKGTNSSGANESTGLLPKPGNASAPASGVGANSVFKVDNAQLGKKLGKHVEDFGGNASSAADRQMVLNKIHEIGNSPDKIIAGTFSGQGANGARGDVFFRIKGNDVVVTKPNGAFVTILKDGVTNNTSVKNALKGNP